MGVVCASYATPVARNPFYSILFFFSFPFFFFCVCADAFIALIRYSRVVAFAAAAVLIAPTVRPSVRPKNKQNNCQINCQSGRVAPTAATAEKESPTLKRKQQLSECWELQS